jgi:hypothetical protein
MGGKYVEALECGIIGGLVVPTGIILLYAAAEILSQVGGVSASGTVSSQDQQTIIFFIWALGIVPLTLLLVGMLASGLAAKYGTGILERSLLSAAAGIIAIVCGMLLFLFISAFLSPADITSPPVDRLWSFTGSLASLATDPLALAALVVYVLIAVAGGIIYGAIPKKKADVNKTNT